MECVFCDALANPDAYALIYRDNTFAILMDKYPIACGHLLIFPTEHMPDILDLPSHQLAALMVLASTISAALKEA